MRFEKGQEKVWRHNGCPIFQRKKIAEPRLLPVSVALYKGLTVGMVKDLKVNFLCKVQIKDLYLILDLYTEELTGFT